MGKGCAHGSQPIDVRSFGLRVTPEVTHPVVQVIDRNKKNVRPIVGRDDGGG
jgi:hypothetical protein